MVKLIYENEITQNWSRELSTSVVSICCTTYNHEEYIEDTIVGFLIQKTNFPFEILIHDDASTDHTQKIIRKYEHKYPNIIKPIYQTENQYSQGIRVNYTFNYLRAKGKYLALCEGDDFWTDPNKLQLQFDVLADNENITLCTHSTNIYNLSSTKLKKTEIKLANKDKVFGPKEVILGGGEFGHTSSFFFKKEMIIDPPEWFTSYPSGDTPLRFLASINQGIYYLDRTMSTYRRGVKGSWTSRTEDEEVFIKHWDRAIQLLDRYDIYTKKKYAKAVKKRKSQIAYRILRKTTNNQKLREQNYKPYLITKEKFKYLIIKFLKK